MEISEADKIKQCFLDAIFDCRSLGMQLSHTRVYEFYSIGINPSAAHHDVLEYYQNEKRQTEASGLLPTYNDIQRFLAQMAYKYSGCSMFVQYPIHGIKSTKGDLHEKQSIHEGGKIAKRTRKIKTKRVRDANELRGSQRKGDEDPAERTVRRRSRKTKIDELRPERVPGQEIDLGPELPLKSRTS